MMDKNKVTQKTINVRELLDSRPIGKYQFFIVLMCFLVVLMDGFDVVIMGFVGPELKASWNWSNDDLAPVLSAALFGLAIGAMMAGPIADKLGRRKVLCACVLLFGLFTLLVVTATDKVHFIIYRFIAGLAMGGIMPMAATLVNEYSPRRKSSFLVTIVFAGFTVGAAGGGFLAKWLVPHLGWESVFVLGGILPILLSVLMYLVMPESLAFLVLKGGSHERILCIVKKCVPEIETENVKFVVQTEREETSQSKIELNKNANQQSTTETQSNSTSQQLGVQGQINAVSENVMRNDGQHQQTISETQLNSTSQQLGVQSQINAVSENVMLNDGQCQKTNTETQLNSTSQQLGVQSQINAVSENVMWNDGQHQQTNTETQLNSTSQRLGVQSQINAVSENVMRNDGQHQQTISETQLNSTSQQSGDGDRINSHLSDQVGTQVDKRFSSSHHNAIRTVLSSVYLLGSLTLWCGYFLHLFLVYLLGSWMPTMIKDSGMSYEYAAVISATFQLGGPLGSILQGWLMDKFEEHKVIIAAYLIGALSLVLMSYLGHQYVLLCLVAFVMGASLNGGGTAFNALSSNFFPLSARATGNSWMHGIGRLGAILSAFSGAWMLNAGLDFSQVAFILSVPALMIVVLLFVKSWYYQKCLP
ncbi:MFS transporter [Basilea psittacipulmonis]|uniref:MFS transporter n=1 Tax=Basilea psittacipulmonis TaxID=1472345 RepID=UPI0006911C04|nr:MFS transporter [Basilea psittacipulmonis]